MDYQKLGGTIRRIRKQLNMTQEQLAEKVGISASFLGHVERGSRKASVETLVGIANALQVGTDRLFAGSLMYMDQFTELRATRERLMEQFAAFVDKTASDIRFDLLAITAQGVKK